MEIASHFIRDQIMQKKSFIYSFSAEAYVTLFVVKVLGPDEILLTFLLMGNESG